MRDIVVFRSASHQVMDELFNQVDLNQVICFVQQSCVKMYQEKYPQVQIVSIEQDYFNCQDFLNKVKFSGKAREIYIPSSTMNFWRYEEIFEIVEHLGYKKLIMWKCNGELTVQKNTLLSKVADTLYGVVAGIYYQVYSIYYKCCKKHRL